MKIFHTLYKQMSIRLELPTQKYYKGDRAQDYSITPTYNENSQRAFRVFNNGVGVVPHVSIPADPSKSYIKSYSDQSIDSGIVVGKGKHKKGMGKRYPKSNQLGNVESSFGQALPMQHGRGKMIIGGDVPTLPGRYRLMPHVQSGGDFTGVNKYGAYKGGVPNIIPW